jgi:predicted HNH restriction endonuclease
LRSKSGGILSQTSWWDGDASERFWLEATDRDDIGSDLRAPLQDESGRDNWRYTLFRRARIGDVVLHYDKRQASNAIVAASVIAGIAYDHDITWAARGTYARAKGIQPHEQAGYRIPLSGLQRLATPVTLSEIRDSRDQLVELLDALADKFDGPLYFPFELSEKRDPRLLQGYAFKLPRSFIALFPQLAPVSHLTDPSQSVGAPVAVIDEAGDTRRNPAWTRDELILALDLYLQHRTSPPSKTSAEVIGLSDVLNRMGSELAMGSRPTYRNANGVYMKLMNFRRFDPDYTNDGHVGLTRGGKEEELVWNEFSKDVGRLSSVAAAIRAAVDQIEESGELVINEESGLEEAPEGRLLTRLHRYRERNPRLVKECKQRALKQLGVLNCAACGFDFGKRYGAAGEGIIECHHTKPVHTLSDGATTKVAVWPSV